MIDLNKKTYRNILQAQLDRVPNSLDKREGSMIQTALGAYIYISFPSFLFSHILLVLH